MSKFRAWYVEYQDEISWFLIGWLSLTAVDCFIEQKYAWAAISAVLVYANYKMSKFRMKWCMASLAEYFAANRPVAKYNIGDRVIGKYHGVPFVGTCGADVMVNESVGPLVTVFLDLPLKHKDQWHELFVKVKYKDIKLYR